MLKTLSWVVNVTNRRKSIAKILSKISIALPCLPPKIPLLKQRNSINLPIQPKTNFLDKFNDILKNGILNEIFSLKPQVEYKKKFDLREYVYNLPGVSYQAVDFILKNLEAKDLLNAGVDILIPNICHLNRVYQNIDNQLVRSSSWVERVCRSQQIEVISR